MDKFILFSSMYKDYKSIADLIKSQIEDKFHKYNIGYLSLLFWKIQRRTIIF